MVVSKLTYPIILPLDLRPKPGMSETFSSPFLSSETSQATSTIVGLKFNDKIM